MPLRLFSALYFWFHPTIDALTAWNIPWKYRWRLLLLQPVALITNSLGILPYAFSQSFTVEWLPLDRGRTIRVLVFDHPTQRRSGKLRPLHLDMHAGAFIGGIPENSAPFCERLALETGALVISTSYRLAPKHHFPAAIDDVDDVVRYLHSHARERWGADPELMTTSGASAGGNLALALAQQPSCHAPSRTEVKASVLFYAPIDLRLRPEEKPKSPELLKSSMKTSPLDFLLPLYDSYPGPVRSRNMENPRMSPVVASIDTLPENILLIVAGMDIIVHEQLAFVERVKHDLAQKPQFAGRKIEALYMKGIFHGFLDLPYSIVPRELHDQALDAGVEFISNVHKIYGWEVAE